MRTTFATSAKSLLDQFNLDGIDIDWEHPQDTNEGRNLTQLLTTLRSYLPAPLYCLTCALPAGAWALRNIPNLAQCVAYLDTLNLMGYDFTGSWSPVSGNHSQLYGPPDQQSCNAAVQYCISNNVPANKLLLGIPCYGRSFLNCTKANSSFSGCAGEDGVFEYTDLPRPGATESVDDKRIAAYCVGGDGGWTSYDNPYTVTRKAAYVKQEGLAGLFYWTGTGDKLNTEGLVYSGYTALHS
jgi:chitinase